MFSVVCVYNNPKILNKYLLPNLELQENSYQLILLDNTQHQYKSAAEALNQGAKQATNEYIMFVHQDMDLSSSSWLREVEEVIESLPEVGVVGVVGTRGQGNPSNMQHGQPPKPAGTRQLDHPERVETVDECLAITPRELFEKFQFDPEVCSGWHFYMADYCLTLKKKGYQNYVIPQYCYHRSEGTPFTPDYYATLRKLIKKHRDKYKRINTTTGNWDTRYPLSLQILYDKVYRYLIRT